jgi:hypothetical protein
MVAAYCCSRRVLLSACVYQWLPCMQGFPVYDSSSEVLRDLTRMRQCCTELMGDVAGLLINVPGVTTHKV